MQWSSSVQMDHMQSNFAVLFAPAGGCRILAVVVVPLSLRPRPFLLRSGVAVSAKTGFYVG